MLSGLLNLHRDAEHGDGDKQEHAEECVDAFHFQHPAKTINLSDTFTLYKPARAIYTRV